MKQSEITSSSNQIVWFNSELVPDFRSEWFSDTHWHRHDAVIGKAFGRGTTTFFSYAGHEMVLRHYLRGGLPGKFLTDQYLYTGLQSTRAWREMRLLMKMLELSLPVPEPVAARVSRHGFMYRSDIVLLKIPGAVDIHNILLEKPLTDIQWQHVGFLIAQFHLYQVYHHDLNIHNIMADNSGKLWLIDFDKCAIKTGESWKKKNLERLLRSLNKEASAHPEYHFSNEKWQLVIKGYNAFPKAQEES